MLPAKVRRNAVGQPPYINHYSPTTLIIVPLKPREVDEDSGPQQIRLGLHRRVLFCAKRVCVCVCVCVCVRACVRLRVRVCAQHVCVTHTPYMRALACVYTTAH